MVVLAVVTGVDLAVPYVSVVPFVAEGAGCEEVEAEAAG